MAEQKKKPEDWMNSKWRPMMGWMYMVVCTMDMVVFPILWSLLQTVTHTPITQWDPLTLKGAGLFHVAMGAVLGLAAWGRTQEKLGGANNGGIQPPPSSSPIPSAQPLVNSGDIQSPKPSIIQKSTTVTTVVSNDLHPDDPQFRNTRND